MLLRQFSSNENKANYVIETLFVQTIDELSIEIIIKRAVTLIGY